jgi:hypothetical protein
MKKILVSCLALAALAPVAAQAGIDATWGSCAGPQNINLNCTQTPTTANSNYNLYFQAKLIGEGIADAVSAECYSDLTVPGTIGSNTSPSTHPQAFWQYQAGGCAGGGVVAFDVIPGTCTGYLDLSDGDGSGGSEAFGYREDWDGTQVMPGNGRFLATVARDASMPVAFAAGDNIWIVELRFNTRRRHTCTGCNQPATITFQEAIIRSASGEAFDGHAAYADKASNCATINNGPPGQCDAVPTQSTTWGKIKSLYR